MGPIVVIVILVAAGYLLVVRPSQRRSRSHAAMQDSVVVGDEVITAGGIHGLVREAEETELRIEIAPEVVVTVDRRAVAAVAVTEDEEPEPEEGEPEEPAEPGNGPDAPEEAVHTESERKSDSAAS